MALPYFKLFVNDWLEGTEDLSLEEIGVYITLLVKMWTKGGSLPNDDEHLSKKILKIPTRKWKKIRRNLFDKLPDSFFINEEKLYNKRLIKEYQKAQEKSEKNSESVKARHEREKRERKKNLTNVPTNVEETYNENSTNVLPRAYNYNYSPLNKNTLQGSGDEPQVSPQENALATGLIDPEDVVDQPEPGTYDMLVNMWSDSRPDNRPLSDLDKGYMFSLLTGYGPVRVGNALREISAHTPWIITSGMIEQHCKGEISLVNGRMVNAKEIAERNSGNGIKKQKINHESGF